VLIVNRAGASALASLLDQHPLLMIQATITANFASYVLCILAPGATTCTQERRFRMFLILAVVLVILWLGGFFVLHVSSFLIHLLLIFAVISIIMNFVSGKRSV
jgi:hypothetical protein